MSQGGLPARSTYGSVPSTAGHRPGRLTTHPLQEEPVYTKLISVAAIVLTVVTACKTVTEPRGQRVIGILEWHSGAQGNRSSESSGIQAQLGVDPLSPRITAPDTVQADIPFTIVITTVGLSGCWREAGAEVEASSRLAVITPYDYAPDFDKDVACTGVLVDLPRSVEIRFTERGNATLRVNGRKVIGGNYNEATMVTVEKRIFVR